MEFRTMGLACAKEIVEPVLSALRDTSFELAWVVHSFDDANIFDDGYPSVVLAQCASSSPGFWPFLERIARAERRPALAVFGPASHRDVFTLGTVGVDEYLERLIPGELSSLATRQYSALESRLLTVARESVGHVGVKDAQRMLRIEMFRTALHRTDGNRHATARLLGVDRRYVLKMLRERPEIDAVHDAEPSDESIREVTSTSPIDAFPNCSIQDEPELTGQGQ